MNSRNLSRFHKFSGNNEENNINKIQLYSSLHSSQIQIQKRNKKIKNKENKIKIYSKLYTKFLSFPFFLGSEDGGYFTTLTWSIYTVKRKWAESPKSSRWTSQRKSPAHCPMSRPQVDVATWISLLCSSSVATLLLLLRPVFL